MRLVEARTVGGALCGLRPYDARILYLTMIRPVIEFGMTTLPYKQTYIESLEKLQYKCLRQLFGFQSSTKKETMLVCVGVPSICARYASLKLTFGNKILGMEREMYVRKILTESWDCGDGFGADIRAVIAEWDHDPDFVDLTQNLLHSEPYEGDHLSFHALIKSTMERLDFERCKHALTESAVRGSGQASSVLNAIATYNTHCLLPLLRVEIPRHNMVQYTRSLVGCDFVTPTDHSKKPKCKFCKSKKVWWPHILFCCKERDCVRNIEQFFQIIKNKRESTESYFEVRKCKELSKLVAKL